jgi:hypothetical protein
MSKNEANYHKFDTLPENWTRPVWTEGDDDCKVVNKSDPYKWSGDNAPPAIGAKVKVYMNSLGNGEVVGYFSEYGWLGVLVVLSKPPSWWRKQTRERGENPATTPAHIYGKELEPYTKKEAATT